MDWKNYDYNRVMGLLTVHSEINHFKEDELKKQQAKNGRH